MADSSSDISLSQKWVKDQFDKMGLTYDPVKLQHLTSSKILGVNPEEGSLHKHVLMNLARNHFFIVLLVELQCKRKRIHGPISEDEVKLTSNYEIKIVQHPTVMEAWKNKFDNHDIWKKLDVRTKWINFMLVGPFNGVENAKTFEEVWTNRARGFGTLIVKVSPLVFNYNERAKDKVKVYLTPFTKEDHFNIMTETTFTPNSLFPLEEETNLNPCTSWSIDFGSQDGAVVESGKCERIKDFFTEES